MLDGALERGACVLTFGEPLHGVVLALSVQPKRKPNGARFTGVKRQIDLQAGDNVADGAHVVIDGVQVRYVVCAAKIEVATVPRRRLGSGQDSDELGRRRI